MAEQNSRDIKGVLLVARLLRNLGTSIALRVTVPARCQNFPNTAIFPASAVWLIGVSFGTTASLE